MARLAYPLYWNADRYRATGGPRRLPTPYLGRRRLWKEEGLEMSVEDQMGSEDLESMMQLLNELRDLIRSEHLTYGDRLSTIDQAVTIATEGRVEQARDFVRDVVLGRQEP
jgi:hypothetical protein